MKILVTGGAGFIGSNLIDRLLDLGHEVVCLDNLLTGKLENIKHHLDNPKFKFIKGDIRDLEICRKAIKDCELVSHQAALGSVPRSIADPLTTHSINVDGFLNVLIAARDEKVKRFIYASSSSVYGDSPKLPKVENEIGRPLSPYAAAKLMNEIYADVFSKNYKMKCLGLRYFNVFGKRQDPNGPYAAVIPLWVKKFIKKERPIINGDGSYTRDFTFIDNVIQANEKALFTSDETLIERRDIFYKNNDKFILENQYQIFSDKSKIVDNLVFKEVNSREKLIIHFENDGSFHEVFNIAYGKNFTLNQLFNSIRESLSRFDNEIINIEPVYGPFREGDIHHSLASIKKAMIVLSYNPEYNLENGLNKAVEWYYNNLN